MEQYIEYSVAQETPAMIGMIYVCAWCQRVKVPGSDPRQPKSWKVAPNNEQLSPGIFLSHGICPTCKARMS